VSQVANLYGGDGFEIAPGVAGRPLFGDGAMLNLIDLEPGAEVALHSHPHEQLGLVIEGELTLVIDGVRHVLHPGDGYTISGGVAHSAQAESGACRVLDVFQPVREDYRTRFESA
jgi:quercetin dioxygenase-like cupin family protein